MKSEHKSIQWQTPFVYIIQKFPSHVSIIHQNLTEMTAKFNLLIKRGGSKKNWDKDQFKIMRTDNTLSDTIRQTHASKCKIQNFSIKLINLSKIYWEIHINVRQNRNSTMWGSNSKLLKKDTKVKNTIEPKKKKKILVQNFSKNKKSTCNNVKINSLEQ